MASAPAITPLGDGSGADAPGWLFLLCRDDQVDPAMADPRKRADLFQRLGLTGATLHPSGIDEWPLDFAGTPLRLVQGQGARSLFDAAMTERRQHHAGPPPSEADRAVGTLYALRLADEAADRPSQAQRLCAVAALLAPLLGARFLYWKPARLWSDAIPFADAVIAMQAHGIPPVLHLIAFAVADATAPIPALDSPAQLLVTHGLTWFTGFELAVTAPASLAVPQLLRRAARLAIDAMLNGDPGGPLTAPGLEPGELVSIGAIKVGCDGEDVAAVLPVTIHLAARD